MQKSIRSYLTLPTLATICNLVSGLIAIYAAMHHDYLVACLLLFVGAWFDAVDGHIAKRYQQSTTFGAEMDSLADLIAFGVAPMVIIMNYYGILWLSALSLLLPVCGALRLARYNVNREKTPGYFIGLPIDASCLVIPLLLFFGASQFIAAAAIVLLCWLYISTIKVPRLFT